MREPGINLSQPKCCLICCQIFKVGITKGLSVYCVDSSLLAWRTNFLRTKNNMNVIPVATTGFQGRRPSAQFFCMLAAQQSNLVTPDLFLICSFAIRIFEALAIYCPNHIINIMKKGPRKEKRHTLQKVQISWDNTHLNTLYSPFQCDLKADPLLKILFNVCCQCREMIVKQEC